MKKTSSRLRIATAESIARKADKGEDISSFFTNQGKMMPPVDTERMGLAASLLAEVDKAARKLKVTRAALIKQFIRRGLDDQHRSQKQRKAG